MTMTDPNQDVRSQFEAWYPGSGVDGCTCERVAARVGYAGGYQAALQSPAVRELVEALKWYIENDDTNIGQEGNEPFEAGLNRAKAALRTLGAGHE